MLRIGYVRLHDSRSAEDTAALKAVGCQVVRAEEVTGVGCEDTVLQSILEFVGDGDEVVVARLEQLSEYPRIVLDILDRLDARGAGLLVVDAEICSRGEGGRALRAALRAVAGMRAVAVDSQRRKTVTNVNQILAMQEAGIGPGEIARRLGVSRMTVWRKLRAVEAA